MSAGIGRRCRSVRSPVGRPPRWHDGAQQHFLALGLMIGAAEEMTDDLDTRRRLGEIRGQLEHALAALRRLA